MPRSVEKNSEKLKMDKTVTVSDMQGSTNTMILNTQLGCHRHGTSLAHSSFKCHCWDYLFEKKNATGMTSKP